MEDHCQFYVVRKKRYCRMTLRAGSKYCGEHEPKVENLDIITKDNPNVRIACPLDPKHSCFANKLEKHLKICNAKQVDSPPYISKNYNVVKEEEDSGLANKRCLSDVTELVLKGIVELVENIYDEMISGKITSYPDKECHPSVVEDIDNDGRKDGTRRHLLQTSSLLYILESENLVKANTCFVELGAGKGHLSYYLSKAVNKVPDCGVVLVDRASHRHKQDNKLKDDCTVKINRIRADISDIVLSKIPSVKDSSFIVAVSKHLCGVATDLALRCLTKQDIVDKTAGLVMATCCHHRCIWDSYVGQSFLQVRGIDRAKFDVICGLVSWATCGSGLSRERRNNSESDLTSSTEPKRSKLSADFELSSSNVHCESSTNTSITEKSDSINRISVSRHLGLSWKQREEIGCKAKAILDWGRVVFLKDNNFESKLCFYVSKTLSPENVCIVAIKHSAE